MDVEFGVSPPGHTCVRKLTKIERGDGRPARFRNVRDDDLRDSYVIVAGNSAVRCSRFGEKYARGAHANLSRSLFDFANQRPGA